MDDLQTLDLLAHLLGLQIRRRSSNDLRSRIGRPLSRQICRRLNLPRDLDLSFNLNINLNLNLSNKLKK